MAALGEAVRALDASRHAAAALERSADELAAAMAGSAFDGEEQARAALLSAAELAAVQLTVEEHTLLGQRVQLLQDSEPVRRARADRAAGQVPPDVDAAAGLRSRTEELDDAVRDLQVRSGVLQASDRQLQSYGPRLARPPGCWTRPGSALTGSSPWRKRCAGWGRTNAR